ncbi:histidine decarboxylase maturation protein HdcB [Limosilactobacillus agrestimuris]|uniref:histidine decarboxylase maturation protein HdcB n=1 Tax=Limosilactobacillus agrestimuris TaxID=2941331 RepID=UPI00203CA8C7|nr:histidine decarboxylase maturation protein HdcB [Limosilactobacillus agrestimuris]
MSDNYSVSIQRIKKVVPKSLITNDFESALKDTQDRMSQVIVNDNHRTKEILMTSIHNFYRYVDGKMTCFKKDGVKDVKFIKGTPHGKLVIDFYNFSSLQLDDIVNGRAFDFIQDIKPKTINHAGYDNTIRGEFPQLLDPDHAEEIDRLRRWMQDGHISHYEYDDANPVYPKAGK